MTIVYVQETLRLEEKQSSTTRFCSKAAAAEFVAAFWFVGCTPLLNCANMELQVVPTESLQIPCLVNTKAVAQDDVLNLPGLLIRQMLCDYRT